MRKYALFFVGIAAVLFTGAQSGGDGCALSAARDHACCAETAPEPSSSCCSTMETSEQRTETDHQTGCDCIHAPSTPADVVASTAPPAPDDDAFATASADGRIFGGSVETRTRTIEGRFPTHPPPPAFLLDCAFLI